MLEEPELCSIFRLTCVLKLLGHPDITLVRFRQGLLGQVSPKPAQLPTLRLPTLSVRLEEHIDGRPTAYVPCYN